MKLKLTLLFSIVFCFAFAQQPNNPFNFTWKNSTIGLYPFTGYSSDTSWQFGVVEAMLYRPPYKDSRLSTFSVKQMYTLKDQFKLDADYFVFPTRYLYMQGTGGFQNYPAVFYGIGNTTPSNFAENYTSKEVKADISVYVRVRPYLWLGVASYSSDTDIVKLKMDNEHDAIPADGFRLNKVVGATGGGIAGAGPVIRWDSTDNDVYPTRGWRIDLKSVIHPSPVSEYDFNNYEAELRHYLSLGGDQVLAFQAAGNFASGDVPFWRLPGLGGSKGLRGVGVGRSVGKQTMLYQAEYRAHLWNIFALGVFAGMGQAANSMQDFKIDKMRFAAGMGLRIRVIQSEKFSLRLDYGIADYGEKGFYISAGEAF